MCVVYLITLLLCELHKINRKKQSEQVMSTLLCPKKNI
uniref:Uncharacterized protein n=1 Tax=Rhizophora mucronata TaxID=61149 RepID=A0A2P2PJ34_RHIMU